MAALHTWNRLRAATAGTALLPAQPCGTALPSLLHPGDIPITESCHQPMVARLLSLEPPGSLPGEAAAGHTQTPEAASGTGQAAELCRDEGSSPGEARHRQKLTSENFPSPNHCTQRMPEAAGRLAVAL